MTGRTIATVVRAVRGGATAMRYGIGDQRSHLLTIRVNPDTFRAMVTEEGMNADELIRLEGNRLAGRELVVDPAVDPATIVLESAPWVSEIRSSAVPGVRLTESATYRATVPL